MPTSILTPDAKKAALAEVRQRAEGYKVDIAEIKTSLKGLAKEAKSVQDQIVSGERALAKFQAAYELAERKYEEIKATEVTPPKVSKNGKPLGRPRLTEEEKAARKAAKSAAGVADPVVVPPDLVPLIPNEVPEHPDAVEPA